VVTVEQAGIDTWSLSWRVREDSPAARAMRELASVRVARGFAMPEQIEGHKVGWFPSARLLFAEGHPGGDRLGNPAELAAVMRQVEEGIMDYGIPLPPGDAAFDRSGSIGFAGVRRLDVTADLRFGSGAEGLAALAGVAAMQMPRMKSATWRGPRGHLETVAFYGYTGKKMLGRWYDKGIEAASAPRGTLIRPEDQRRWGAGSRRTVEELTTGYVREKWVQRFRPLWQATKGITVGGHSIIAEKLAELVAEERITPRQAESLLGYATFEANGHSIGKRSTKYNRRAALRRAGLVMADDALTEVEVDLSAVLDAALEADCWGRG
jgi:hypothetical protein